MTMHHRIAAAPATTAVQAMPPVDAPVRDAGLSPRARLAVIAALSTGLWAMIAAVGHYALG